MWTAPCGTQNEILWLYYIECFGYIMKVNRIQNNTKTFFFLKILLSKEETMSYRRKSPFWIEFFYLSHTRLYSEYITSSEMYSLHLTHPKWTHPEQWAAMLQPGEQLGSVPCSRTPQSWYWRRRERWLFTPSPTIPAGPEIRTHNLWITSPTL